MKSKTYIITTDYEGQENTPYELRFEESERSPSQMNLTIKHGEYSFSYRVDMDVENVDEIYGRISLHIYLQDHLGFPRAKNPVGWKVESK